MRSRTLALAAVALLAACSDDGGATSTGSTGATTSSGSGGAGGAGTTASTTSGTGGATSATTGAGGGAIDPFAGPVKSLTVVDAGTDGVASNVFFDLPDRVLGFTLLSETTAGTTLGVFRLRPPSLSSVVSQYAIPGTGLQVFADVGKITAADPQSDLPDAWPVQTGSWWLVLGSDSSNVDAHTRVFVRRTEDGAFHGGAVDINVFVSPGSGAGQNYLDTALSKLFTQYYTPKIGLTLGNVAYFSLPASYDNVSTTDGYRALLASSAGVGTAPALNLFVIGSFTGDFQNALGVAGGIPGSPMVHGTERSGVAYTPTGDTSYDASVLAHEVGHLAGLFHTSEFQVSAFDPLADTPSCPNIMNVNPSSCPDVNNVMFPIAYGGTVMTTWQARVMQGSALYRGALTEGGPFSGPLSWAPPGSTPPSPFVSTPTAFQLARTTARAPRSLTERTLSGHFCAESPGIVDALATELDPSELEALALDPGAFDVTRAHAIAVLARLAAFEPSAAHDDALRNATEAILADPSAGRQASLAAARAAGTLDVETAEWAAERLAGSLDPVVRSVADEALP